MLFYFGMAYTERQLKVLREFCILDDDNQLVCRRLCRPEDKPLGMGPKLEASAVQRLIDVDATEGQVWLEWIFNQAAGGSAAKESSERALEQMKQRFMDERLHGYQHARTREIYPKLPKEDAERRYVEAEPKFREVLFYTDQDLVDKFGVSGFYRHWPGKDSVYANIEKTVKTWLALQPKLAQMNDELAAEDKERLPVGPSGIDSVDALVALVTKVERYFMSKAARMDVRLAKCNGNDYIYNDDYIIALSPLTYAAAVRYGCDSWLWANRETFERVLLDESQNFADAWKADVQRGLFYVYLRFKCPVPRWVARKNNRFHVYELTNLALQLNRASTSLINDYEKLCFFNEEGHATMHFSDICQLIRQEPYRKPVEDNEMPIICGPNVYTSVDECETVILHLRYALDAVATWAKSFNPDVVVADALAFRLSAELRVAKSS